jgi:coiled-coil domain-containing protein 130
VRAHKIGQGILVIRFEMPYSVWCGGCAAHIGKGVRFNAEKRTVGQYLSTRIFEFSMKCPHCSQRIVIRTNPQACDYDVVSGATRKSEHWEKEEGDGDGDDGGGVVE